MSVSFDGLKNMLYSIGEDGILQVINITQKAIVGSARVIVGKLCQMIYLKNVKKCFISDRQGAIHIFDNIPITPTKIHQIQTESTGSLRGMCYDPIKSNLFTCCYEDGRIYGYNLGPSLKNSVSPQPILNIIGDKFCRQIVYIASTDQLALGYSNGMIVFYDLQSPKNPFYSRKIHNSEITSLQYFLESDELVSSSKDQNIKFFQMLHKKERNPEEYKKTILENNQLENEENEILNFQKPAPKVEAKPELPKKQPVVAQQEEESSSEEDLTDWN